MKQLNPYIQSICDYKFGLKYESADVKPLCAFDKEPERYLIKLPYGNQHLQWEIIFNAEKPFVPPDVIADDGFFETVENEIVFEKVPSLRNWNPADPNCLLKFVLELRNLYQSNQVAMLKSNENLKRYFFEYETLISMGIVDPADFELFIHQCGRSAGVDFFFPLKLDTMNLPSLKTDDQRSAAILSVKYRIPNECKISLAMSEALEDYLDKPGLDSLSDLIVLFDYVPELTNLLQSKIHKVKFELEQKELMLSALAALVEQSIVDVDSVLFKKMSFTLVEVDHQAFCCVELPDRFPAERPILSYLKTGQKISMVKEYPFDARWSHDDMAMKIISVLKKKALGVRERNYDDGQMFN